MYTKGWSKGGSIWRAEGGKKYQDGEMREQVLGGLSEGVSIKRVK